MFGVLDISTSGLVAQRARLDAIASNIANAQNTRGGRDPSGRVTPYRRLAAVFASATDGRDGPGGVRVAAVVQDPSEFRKVHDPGHPDAGADGYVLYPNVDLATEYVNALEATRAYEANIAAMEATKAMVSASLRLLA